MLVYFELSQMLLSVFLYRLFFILVFIFLRRSLNLTGTLNSKVRVDFSRKAILFVRDFLLVVHDSKLRLIGHWE